MPCCDSSVAVCTGVVQLIIPNDQATSAGMASANGWGLMENLTERSTERRARACGHANQPYAPPVVNPQPSVRTRENPETRRRKPSSNLLVLVVGRGRQCRRTSLLSRKTAAK